MDTGDLGVFHDGQLVITGRTKDLVIVNGLNFYPHDIERLAEQVPGIEANRVAAAGVRRRETDTEQLALFVLSRGDLQEFASKATALRRQIERQIGLDVAEIVPVKAIPKTTSGKLQRYLLAEAYERGDFDAVLAELAPLMGARGVASAEEAGGTPTAQHLLRIVATVVPDKPIDASTNLLEINLTSLSLARIHEAIERDFPNRIDVTDLFEYPTLEQLADLLDTQQA
jgi:acyl carrier protein